MSFIHDAYAQTAAPAAQQGTAELINTFMMFGLIFLVFYFLVIRPQQKKVKLHREMLSALRRGDRVVTSGGIIGLVTRVTNEQEVILEIADNVRVKVVRDTIATVLAKTEPTASAGGKAKDDGTPPGPAANDGDGPGGDDKGPIAGLKKLLSGKK